MTGRFITLEGGEGTGKSTQVRRLAAALQSHGKHCLVTREPGGSPGAEEIRALLVNGAPGRWDALTETLLALRRARRPCGAHDPSRAGGRPLRRLRPLHGFHLCLSGRRPRHAARNHPPHRIHRAEDFKPDLTLVLDLPADVGLARARSRGAAESRFENFDAQFHERLRQAFLDIAKRAPDRCVVIDAAAVKTKWRARCGMR